MSDATTAYAAARHRIARAAETGATELDFNTDAFRALATLPPEIANLPALTWLFLHNTQITDATPLAKLTELTLLSLHNTQIADAMPLANLAALKTLGLNNTQITDATPLANLAALTSLSLSDTQITDAAPLANLAALTSLYLNNTQITDATPLANLAALTSLFLSNTQIGDLRPIRGLAALKPDKSGFTGLYFSGSLAARLDPQLATLAAIEDTQTRTTQTLAYLNSLDDTAYDAFLARRRVDLGLAPAPQVKPSSPTATARARTLAPQLENARPVILPLSGQISDLLNQWLNDSGTNQLPEALQQIERIATSFALTVQVSGDSPDHTALAQRLTALEADFAKLTTLLKQEQAKTAALQHQLDQTFDKGKGFWNAARESAGTELGKRGVQAAAALTVAGGVYLLGENSSLVQALIKSLPKP